LKVDDPCATAVLRIFQETLTNIARHAEARRVAVSIFQDHNYLCIEIHDDGVGISDERLKNKDTFGILGMKERALLFGGSVEIEGSPGKGTVVTIKIPFEVKRDQDTDC